MVKQETIIKTVGLNCCYGSLCVLKDVNLEIYKNEILGIIGPANSGKTTFLRALNKLNYLNSSYSQKGDIYFSNESIKNIGENILRRKIGIIFALPQVLPVSIFDNVASGPTGHGVTGKNTISQV